MEATEVDQQVQPVKKPRRWRFGIALFFAMVIITVGVAALLTSVFERKQEARNPYLKLVEVTEDTTDPAKWGMNFPSQYDGYKRTADVFKTRFGGSDTFPAQKAEKEPWLKRMFAGYAFAMDYRDRRGHAFMLFDQEHTDRVLKKPQPGACLNCHSSVVPAYRFAGNGDVQKGFEAICAMPYQQAHDLVNKDGIKLIEHPVSCVDCHDPNTMKLRVTRPAFMTGIKALKAKQGVADYDVNRDATRQEMRTYACAQCHVEYYFKGPGKLLTYPWANGNKIEEIEAYYDKENFTDWKHAESGAPMLKAQHPEFELWSQGIHARNGVSCADCHMPFKREGALKVSDHHVRSPMLNIARACQQCHHVPESEIQARVDTIQNRTHDLMSRAAIALTDMLDEIGKAKKAGVSEAQLDAALKLHRRAQWRLDFVAAENSMGFHAPQESARILGEAIDFARQAQLEARAALPPSAANSKP